MNGGHRRCVAGALVAGVACVLVGCGVPRQQAAESIPEREVPVGLRSSEPVNDQATVDREPVDLWFSRDGRLMSARHVIPSPVTASVAIAELLAGPTEDEQSDGLRSAIPDAAVVVSVETSRGGATVELSSGFGDIPVADQVLAVGQLVLTLTDLRGVGRVSFVVDDEAVTVPLPTGETAPGAVVRDDYLLLTMP
ncbi:MAG: hypothetical protein RLZZ362_1126 [Actinomycetota bacterium]|jgi:spore germination protein GerM